MRIGLLLNDQGHSWRYSAVSSNSNKKLPLRIIIGAATRYISVVCRDIGKGFSGIILTTKQEHVSKSKSGFRRLGLYQSLWGADKKILVMLETSVIYYVLSSESYNSALLIQSVYFLWHVTRLTYVDDSGKCQIPSRLQCVSCFDVQIFTYLYFYVLIKVGRWLFVPLSP